MPKRLIHTIALILASGAAAVTTAAMTLAAQPGPTLRVLAGLGQGVVSVNQYAGDPAFPEGNTVRVAEGTTVIWTLGSDEPHTITFRAGEPWPSVFMEQPEGPGRPPMYNPKLLSAAAPAGPWDGTSFIHLELQGRGQEVSVTFAREGRYRYSCLFHEEMDGFVEVVAPGSAGITTQAVVDQFAASHLADDHAADTAKMIADRSRASRIDTPGGASLWFVRAGTNERRGHVDVNAFLPEALSVRQGDTIVWYTDHSVPHTVTFSPPGGPNPELLALQLPDGTMVPPPSAGQPPSPTPGDPATAPRLVAIGGVATRPSPVYDGRSFYNSGLIGEHPLVAYPMERTWALTFDTPGTFQYVCLLHEQQGMKGTLTVTPR